VPKRTAIAVLVTGVSLSAAAQDLPKVLRPDLVLELYCREPDIVTPVAIDVDSSGRVWAIESNTHFPKADYKRHTSDRILVISDTNQDGAADRFDVFADGLEQSMGLALRPGGVVWLATRRDVLVLEDTDQDGRADRRTFRTRLETREQYPHNGLSGFAFDGHGRAFFAIGENMGVPYKLTASDGSAVSGGPEGGSIFRMREDGSSLERWAVGFWNTFHMTLDPDGRLFAVDNDPDSRPPCRLLHIVRGGDYGYRRWLGRKGLHPFTAWNGELPGTLPMVAGTGEAPSGVLWNARSLVPELERRLIVTSWGDHRIEAYELEPRGASFRSRPVPIVQGGENFRPVGIAAAPDGSIYFSDWVDQDYHVHMKGRIWRLRAKTPSVRAVGDPPPPGPPAPPLEARLKELDRFLGSREGDVALAAGEVLHRIGSDRDAFLEGVGAEALARACGAKRLLAELLLSKRPRPDARERLLFLLALRRTQDPLSRSALPVFLDDPDLDVRRAAIQWVGEEKISEHSALLDKALESPGVSRSIFDAVLASKSLLAGEAPDGRDQVSMDDALVPIVLDERRPAAVRALALASIAPLHPALSVERLRGLASSPDETLSVEAIRTLRSSPRAEATQALRSIAEARGEPAMVRREAIAGLGARKPSCEALLDSLAGATEPSIAREAARTLRFTSGAVLPGARESWDEAARTEVLSGGDRREGEILFFYPVGPRCSTCHSVRGRGGAAGPDLSAAGAMPRTKLLDSILEPHREIAPQFASWTFVTQSGVRTGIVLGEDPDGSIRLADSNGLVEALPREAILERSLSQTSLMPENLARLLTPGELRDLLAFLESLK